MNIDKIIGLEHFNSKKYYQLRNRSKDSIKEKFLTPTKNIPYRILAINQCNKLSYIDNSELMGTIIYDESLSDDVITSDNDIFHCIIEGLPGVFFTKSKEFLHIDYLLSGYNVMIYNGKSFANLLKMVNTFAYNLQLPYNTDIDVDSPLLVYTNELNIPQLVPLFFATNFKTCSIFIRILEYMVKRVMYLIINYDGTYGYSKRFIDESSLEIVSIHNELDVILIPVSFDEPSIKENIDSMITKSNDTKLTLLQKIKNKIGVR